MTALTRSRALVPAALFALAAAGAVWLAERALPPGPVLHGAGFQLRRSARAELEILPRKPLELPFPFADFDLEAEIRLGENTELDVVVRRVEPVRREHGEVPFHGRFAVARLSTYADGPALLDRETALFDLTPKGHRVPAGASVRLSVAGRDRGATVAVDGVGIGTVPTADAHGGIALVVRGPGEAPRATVASLTVEKSSRPRFLLPIGWAAILGGVVGLLAGALGADRSGFAARCAVALAALGAGGWAGGTVVLGRLAPEVEPTVAGVAAAALCGLPLAVAVSFAPRGIAGRGAGLVLGVALGLGGLELAARLEAPRIPAFDDRRLSAVFGPASGSAPFDALAGRVRSPAAVHFPGREGETAFFLGGGPIFEETAVDPSRWVARMAVARLSDGSPAPRAVVVPTVFANLRQQLLLFETFHFATFRPEILCVGVAPWEPEVTESAATLDCLERAFDAGLETPDVPSGPALGTLFGSTWAEERPATDLAAAMAAVERAADLAEVFDTALLLVLSPELPAPWLAQLGTLARGRGGVVVEAPLGGDPGAVVDPLVDGLRRARAR